MARTEYKYSGGAGFHHETLQGQIEVAGLTIDGVITYDAANCSVVADLSGPDKTTLDGVITAHDPQSLDRKKIDRVGDCRHNTRLIRNGGFLYSANYYSLAVDDLMYVRDLRESVNEGIVSLSVHQETLDGTIVEFDTVGKLDDIITAGETRYDEIAEDEYDLIISINAAVDQAALDAITDTRV